jgi:hypothetical protein
MKPTLLLIPFAALCVAGYVLFDDVQPHETARATPRAAPVPARPAVPAWTPPRHDAGVEPALARDEAPTSSEMHDQLQTAFSGMALGDEHGSTRSLEGAIRAALPAKSKLRSVECRGSLCRVETTHPDADEFRAFVQATFQASSKIPSGPAFVSLVGEPVAGQPMTAVAFMAQPGTELPVHATTATAAR